MVGEKGKFLLDTLRSFEETANSVSVNEFDPNSKILVVNSIEGAAIINGIFRNAIDYKKPSGTRYKPGTEIHADYKRVTIKEIVEVLNGSIESLVDSRSLGNVQEEIFKDLENNIVKYMEKKNVKVGTYFNKDDLFMYVLWLIKRDPKNGNIRDEESYMRWFINNVPLSNTKRVTEELQVIYDNHKILRSQIKRNTHIISRNVPVIEYNYVRDQFFDVINVDSINYNRIRR